jgi:hypothetical protein
MATTQRSAPGRPLAALTGDSSLGAVIAEFLRAAAPGDDRELRSALSHVDAELGTMSVRSIRPRHLTALLDGLRSSGLSRRREAAVVDALHAVFAFAVAHRLVAVDPMPDTPPAPANDMPTPTPTPTRTPTPTFAMLALGARVAFWTTWIITLGFLVLLLVLLVELG